MPKTTINDFDGERQIIPNSLEELEEERKEIFENDFNNPTVYKRKMYSTTLSYLLAVRKIKASELSAVTQVPEPMLSDYIRGKYAPRGNYLFRISNFFRVNPDWMIGIPGSKINNQESLDVQVTAIELINIKEIALSIVKTLDKPLRDTYLYVELLEKMLSLNIQGLTKVNEYASDLLRIKTYKD